jgi:hypothetical protein
LIAHARQSGLVATQKADWMTHFVNLAIGLSGLLGAAIAVLPSAALAQTCRAAPPTPASIRLIDFDIEPLGMTVAIPANYRSMLRSGGHITFHDPNSFAYIQCLVRTGESGEVPPYVALEVYPGVDHPSELIDLIRTRRPWLDYYTPAYEPVEFAGQAGLRYDYTSEIYQLAIANISFLSADGRTLLTLTGPADHPIMVAALAEIATSPLDPVEVPSDLQ